MAEGNEDTLDAIIGRAIRDPEFREKFVEDPLNAAEVEGYALASGDRVALASIQKTNVSNFLGGLSKDPTIKMWCTDQKCYEFESGGMANPGDIVSR